MTPDNITDPRAFAAPVADAERVTAFLRTVYGWMAAGLGITAATAWLVLSSPAVLGTLQQNMWLYIGLVIVELGLVVYLSARVAKMSPAAASGAFTVYAAISGVTLAPILFWYTGTSIAGVFVVTAGMFGAMALFGTMTKRSLAGLGQFAFMGLIGIVLASVVGMFWRSSGLQFGISVIGVIVFTALAAYDAQRLKAMALALPQGREGSYAVVGALSLYLDFINLFLMLLRLFGGRRD